jgi:hypothetical protein
MAQIRRKQIRKSRNVRQRGGASPTRANSGSSCMQQGGSPASKLVMHDATVAPPVMNDYITSPRIREPGHSNSLANLAGGSLASDLVNEQLNENATTKAYQPSWNPKGDMNSLNLYQTTGGARRKTRNSKSHRNKSRHTKTRNHYSKKNNTRKHKSQRNRRNNRSRQQRGGGSDWIMSQYSLGPSNNPEQSASWVSQFSTSGATSRADYMNPSTMGLAGSGSPMGSLEGANVRHIGSPMV